jgi:tRNA threonylcarbamoyladenosine biosynthesis protein TsaB
MVQGLAFASGRPVVPVPTLLALAEQSNESRVIAAHDARMGEAYVAAYARSGDDWNEVIAPRLCDADGLPALPGRRWAATGSGFDRHAWLRDAYRDTVEMRFEGDLPRAGAVARIAVRRLARGGGVAAEMAAPLYLRDKVALTTEERQARQ